MAYELMVNTSFMASHSLFEREEIHEHLWKVQACVTGEILQGRIVSLPQLKNWIDEILEPLRSQVLNKHPSLDMESQMEPTCEYLSRHLFLRLETSLRQHSNPCVQLLWVCVTVVEPDGIELGGVRYFH